MAEEERQDLADFRLHAGLQLRHDIAVEFLRYESEQRRRGHHPAQQGPGGVRRAQLLSAAPGDRPAPHVLPVWHVYLV